MIKSMTGYGKAEAKLNGGTLTIEIRTLNGKSADISLRSSLLPKNRELEVRAAVAAALIRGTIDIYLSWTPSEDESGRNLNLPVLRSYLSQIKAIAEEEGIDCSGPAAAAMLNTALNLPETVEAHKSDAVMSDEEWPQVSAALQQCLDEVNAYRSTEGEVLYKDVCSRVEKILALYNQVESLEKERLDTVKAKILKAAEELQVKLDHDRFEQEMIFYLEKYDINEEKVRLRQHCRYFTDTISSDPCPGKKLGFIIQEMGREINTTGSKANHAGIQKLVVQMKDELEKIREQSMNIL